MTDQSLVECAVICKYTHQVINIINWERYPTGSDFGSIYLLIPVEGRDIKIGDWFNSQTKQFERREKVDAD